MTSPKDYAKELYVKYYNLIESPYEKHQRTIKCAIIAVDEMIESYEFDVISDITNQRYIDKLNYLDEVKTQILNL